MKTLLAICIAALGLSAASLNPIKVTLATPVIVGGVELPPGECTVQQLNVPGDNAVLTFRCADGVSTNVLVNRVSNDKANQTGLTLTFQGGRYLVDQIWMNQLDGYQVLRGE